MTAHIDAVEILHTCEASRLQVSATTGADGSGLGVLTFSGTMCTATVPGVLAAIERWIDRTELQMIGIDLGAVDFIDGRGVSLLVGVQLRAQARGLGWSIVDLGPRGYDVLTVCDLLEPMGVEPLTR